MNPVFDFDTPLERRGTGAIKWEVGENELPMWIGDMDFATAPAVQKTIQKRAEHGAFGYTDINDEWRNAYTNWWHDRHGLDIHPDWLVFATGVIPILSSCVRKLSTPAEKVVVLTPIYNTFFNCILNNGRVPLECPLDCDPETLTYTLNFERLEACLSDPQASLMIFCNPHNPVGKLWDRDTLARVGALCRRYGVIVLSDEIHCDLVEPGKQYVPFASVSDDCRAVSVTCLAPSKAFNIAGIHSAAAMVPDPVLRHKVWRALNTDEVGEPNVFAVGAAVAAFTEGGDWLDALRDYIFENRRYVADYVAAHIPGIRVVPSEATYFLWLDCTALCGGDSSLPDSQALAADIRAKTGLFLTAGTVFHGEGVRFLRLNVACPREYVEDGLARLAAYCKG